VLLWGALRDFLLWLDAPAAGRAALYGADAGDLRRAELTAAVTDPELWAPLLTLAQMTDAPQSADLARLVFAVRSVARWAQRRGAPATRLAFTRAAALALPQDAPLALETGRLARDLARHAQAEAWFRRAIRLARGRDWECYAWGFIGLGVLYKHTGNYPAAGAVVSRALRAARKRRLSGVEGSARHHLFTFSLDAGRMEEAYAHARAALQAYGEGHSRLPALAHDLGCFWAQQGRFARALQIFEAALPWFADAPNRLLALANFARAAAGAGDHPRYARVRQEAAALLADPTTALIAAEALLLLAQGDLSLGDWTRAEEAAGRALAIAEERGERMAQLQAEALLDSARNNRSVAEAAQLAETPRLALEAEELAGALRAWLARPGAAADA